jgi:predicted permease
VATAGLLTRSQLALLEADPGFQAESVLAVEWALPPDGYQDAPAVGGLQERLLERFEATSGVQSAAFASNLPMSGAASGRRYQVQGSDPAATAPVASWRSISTDYFSTLGISLRRGRGFEAADGAGGPRVAVINEALVDRHWPGGADPLGRQLEMDGEVWTVVGVAADVHDLGAQRGAGPTIYVPQAQATTRAGFLVIRVAGEPPGFAGTVRREIWAVDPGVAVDDVRTLQEMVHGFYAGSRVLALLMGVFAVVSLLITVASLYALVTHHVAQHRREIGVRLTLGARPKDVLVATVARVATWVAVGIAVGLGLSAVAAQLLRSVLYGVGALDPVVFVLAPVGFLIAAMIAAYVPARAASRVDPVEVLRT